MRKSIPLLLASSIIVSALPQASPSFNANTSPTITLDYATIIPTAGNSSIGYYKYQNIPFAATPTGPLRWAKPQWPETQNSTIDGSQADASVACNSEEDCLYMDIWM